MNKELERRIEKLPQWAQQHINRLERLNAALVAERGAIADGKARITFTVNYKDVHGLPDRAEVAFRLNNDQIEFSFSREPGSNTVCVRSSVSRLVVEPIASNVIHLSIRR